MRDPQAICDEWNAKYPVGEPTPQEQCDAFNARYPVGTAFKTVFGSDVRTSSPAYPQMTRVGLSPRVYLEGFLGAHYLDVLEPIVHEPTPQEQCDAFNARVKVGDAVTATLWSKETFDGVTEGPAYIGVFGGPRVPVRLEDGHQPPFFRSPEIANVRPKPQVSRAQAECDAFNAKVAVGDTVEIIGIGVPADRKTGSRAIVTQGQACVFLLRDNRPYALSNIRPIDPADAKPTVTKSVYVDCSPKPKPFLSNEAIKAVMSEAMSVWHAKVTGLSPKPAEPTLADLIPKIRKVIDALPSGVDVRLSFAKSGTDATVVKGDQTASWNGYRELPVEFYQSLRMTTETTK